MDRLVWSPQAISDLEGICEFIGRDSLEYARLLAERIVNLAETIPRFPRAGRVVPELEIADLRERIVGNYRVIYRLRPGIVEIVTILHGARNFEV